MLQWIAEITFLGVTGFIAYVICSSVSRKTIAQMVIVVTLLMGLQTTIENLDPVFKRWSSRIDSFQNSLDKVGNIGKGTWEMPMQGDITQYYNLNNHGIDIAASEGTPVKATREGEVSQVGWNDVYGNVVIVDHGEGITSLYGHLSGIEVKVGYQVIAGTKIGTCGSTGNSTGPHLHFEIRKNGATVDPMDYVKN